MKKNNSILEAVGEVNTSYQVECPHCGDTNYSDDDYKQWINLEWGDGHPHGFLNCTSCREMFYMEIEE